MLNKWSLVIITININYVYTAYKIYSDGWLPVPSNQIYNQIRRDSEYNAIHPILDPKSGNPVSFSSPVNLDKQSRIEETETLYKVNAKAPTGFNIEKEKHANDISNINLIESPRKAKKITYPGIQNTIDTFKVDEVLSNKDDIEVNRANLIADRTVSYSVTEDIDDEQETKYIPEAENQNFNSTLINILSKYIKSDDKLSNYELSRVVRPENSVTSLERAFKSYRYNSLNHLPIDPLLAVFLSNYGFYVPSLYGIKSNFNNLYGYLASNNIHNYKPFGLYKVFSDTDTWN